MKNYNNLTSLFLLSIILIMTSISPTASAHKLGQSYIFLSIDDNAITGRVELTIADLNKIMNLTLPTDHSVKPSQIEPYIENIKSYYYQNVEINIGKGLLLGDFSLASLGKAQYLGIEFSFEDLNSIPAKVDIEYRVCLWNKF